MKIEATEGKIIRIVEIKKTNRRNTKWFYIIETEDGSQYEVIDYHSTKFYNLGDIIFADNFHYNKNIFQKAKIVKTSKKDYN